MPMLRFPPAGALIAGLFFCSLAHADSDLHDRYMAAGQKMGQSMLEIIEECLPDVDTSDIDFDYTPRMTESAACVIDTHIERFGRDETVALVEETEALADRSFSSMQEMVEIQAEFPRLSTPAMIEINQSCGTIEASQDMALSKLMQEHMSELAACFSR